MYRKGEVRWKKYKEREKRLCWDDRETDSERGKIPKRRKI